MKCLMCGLADSGETPKRKEYRLLTCRRCANVEAGRVARKPEELNDQGGRLPPKPDAGWLKRKGELPRRKTTTPLLEAEAAQTSEEADAILESYLVKKRAQLERAGRPNNLAPKEA